MTAIREQGSEDRFAGYRWWWAFYDDEMEGFEAALDNEIKAAGAGDE